jgi:hypothetical protein
MNIIRDKYQMVNGQLIDAPFSKNQMTDMYGIECTAKQGDTSFSFIFP